MFDGNKCLIMKIAFAVYRIQRKVITRWEKIEFITWPKITNLTRKVKKFGAMKTRRMKIPRMKIRRIENSQNIT
jgi:hypothetical protein